MLDQKATEEGGKTFGRVLLIAVIPVLIDSLSQAQFSWRGTLTALGIAVLLAVDKFIHESKNMKANGLTWF